MKIAYFDCFAGASGNMILGSLIDAGLSREALEQELRRLPVTGWELRSERVRKHGLAALYLDVDVPGEDGKPAARNVTRHQLESREPVDHRHKDGHEHGDHHHGGHEHDDHNHEGIAHRKLGDVLEILHAAHFNAAVEKTATKIYRRLAQAEGRVHGVHPDEIVFHEVGQIDAIIDIAGAALALHLLGIDEVYCSALPCGKGRITSAHGIMPSPAPATIELLRDAPTYQLDVEGEFVTPTGAAILTAVASFDPRPAMTIRAVGYGSGRSDFPFPNVLRVLIGNAVEQRAAAPGGDDVVQIETNIDDMNPQLFEHVVERLFAAGALDVWMQAASMKKGRPGIILSALAPPDRVDSVASVVLAETTSIGVRSWRASRTVLPRRIETVATALGPVRVKIVDAPGGMRAKPEYEDCRAIAQRDGMSLGDVMQRVERDVAQWLDEKRRSSAT